MPLSGAEPSSFTALQGVPTGGCERDDWEAALQCGWKRDLFRPAVRHITPAHQVVAQAGVRELSDEVNVVRRRSDVLSVYS
eukprot:COSAG06_NODE_1124_length_10620_cov_48.182587_10_plen_81_part_00